MAWFSLHVSIGLLFPASQKWLGFLLIPAMVWIFLPASSDLIFLSPKQWPGFPASWRWLHFLHIPAVPSFFLHPSNGLVFPHPSNGFIFPSSQ
jgi:hypothetical protein